MTAEEFHSSDKAISSETKTQKFTITKPSKFMKITLPETNVIEILSVKD